MMIDTPTMTALTILIAAVAAGISKVVIAFGRAFRRLNEANIKLGKIETDSATAVQQNHDLKKNTEKAIEQNSTITAQTNGTLSKLLTELHASRAQTETARAQNEMLQGTISQLTTLITAMRTPPVIVAPMAPREVRESDKQRNGDVENGGGK